MEAREGFTVGEKKTMLLSAETAAGLKLTGITFCISKELHIQVHILHMYGVPAHASHVHPFCYTVKSFVELAQSVLSLPGAPPLLSRQITQDPLERFFGLQRQRGRVNENPNSQGRHGNEATAIPH